MMGPSHARATAVDAEVPPVAQSLFAEGEEEALRYKWIASERAGRDLGPPAIGAWVREHWNGFLRERWIEHLQGFVCWLELDPADFGLLRRAFRGSPLIDEIMWRLKCGQENLDVVNWALAEGLDIDHAIEILEALDINSRRMECKFARRLSHTGGDC